MSTVGPELNDLLQQAVGAVLAGAKRIELQSAYWEVTAYRVITTIRVDIKQTKEAK